MNLQPPINQTADILKGLIEQPGVSEKTFEYNGFRSRISDLRNIYKLNIRFVEKEFVNKFGHKSRYREHFLRDGDKVKAAEVYGEINKK